MAGLFNKVHIIQNRLLPSDEKASGRVKRRPPPLHLRMVDLSAKSDNN